MSISTTKLKEEASKQPKKPFYQLVVLGGGGAGKSAITIQFTQQYFVYDYDPTIQDSYNKQCFIDDDLCKLEVLDTAGQEDFSTMREQYLKSGDGFLIVFSVIDKNSFEEAERLFRLIWRLKDRDDYPIILIANKTDLIEERIVSEEDIQKFAHSYNIPYLTCSAKKRQNVDQAFHDLVRLIRRYKTMESQYSNQDLQRNAELQKIMLAKKLRKKKNCLIQ
uniref:P-loop containing nucleoside triphosphate hydrolase n=1 Tax=Rhabditophanes sp. KR3021 TaxID=114890 RepID=A0AC35U5G6_9BILA